MLRDVPVTECMHPVPSAWLLIVIITVTAVVVMMVMTLMMCGQVVLYLRMCLAQSAGLKPTAQLSELQDQAPGVAGYVSSLLTQHTGDSGPVQSYLSMLRQLLTAVSGSDQCVFVCVCVRVRARWGEARRLMWPAVCRHY